MVRQSRPESATAQTRDGPSGYERLFALVVSLGTAAMLIIGFGGLAERFPDGVQIVVVVIAVTLSLLPCALLLRKSGRQSFIGYYGDVDRWLFALLFLLGLLWVSILTTSGFAFLSSTLYEHGVVTSRPLDEPYNDFWFLYGWNFLDEVPILELPKTIGSEEPPLETTDRVSPVLLLGYKLLVILPVIATAILAWRTRRAPPPARPTSASIR